MPYATNGMISTDEIEGGISISDEQYAAAIQGVIAGKSVSVDQGFEIIDLAPPAVPGSEGTPPTVDDIKATFLALIDSQAEAEREKYITSGSGQAMTYMQKATEAKALVAASDPVASDYPLLAAEVGITANTIEEVAAIVNAAYAQWQQVGAAIEAARLGAKAALNAASTVEDLHRVLQSVVWPPLGGPLRQFL